MMSNLKMANRLLHQITGAPPNAPYTRFDNNSMQIQELSRHLDDLQKLRQEQEQRLLVSSGFIAESIQTTLSVIKSEIKKTEAQLSQSENIFGSLRSASRYMPYI